MTTSAPAYGRLSGAKEIAIDLQDSFRGKNILITGVSVGGLGLATAKSLAPFAGLIIATGRNDAQLQKAIDDIKQEIPGANIRPLILDLSSLASIHKAAAELGNELPIHILINNAATFYIHEVVHTVDGFEVNFGINHIGPFVLTNLLYPNLKLAAADRGPARVVNVSSEAHGFVSAPGIRYDDPHYKKDPASYAMLDAYAYSKMGNVLHAKELAKRWKDDGIVAYSLHPGGIMTTGAMQIPTERWIAMGIMTPEGEIVPGKTKTLDQGAATTVYAALSPTILEHSGAYLVDCTTDHKDLSAAATDDNAERCWKFTEDLVKQASKDLPQAS